MLIFKTRFESHFYSGRLRKRLPSFSAQKVLSVPRWVRLRSFWTCGLVMHFLARPHYKMALKSGFCFGFLLLLGLTVFPGKTPAHYWCNVVGDISFSDSPDCAESKFRIFYLPDSLYWIYPECGQVDTSFNGHCDNTNTVTYFAPGYYQHSIELQETCERVSLGAQPPPQPIARATCTATLEPGPLANAGPSHTATLFERDTLDGSASLPLDGHPIVTYNWVAASDNPGLAVFRDSTTAHPDWIPIAAGLYRFFLSVTDDQGESAFDTVAVNVCASGEECLTPLVRQKFRPPPRGIQLAREVGQLIFRAGKGLKNMSLYSAGGKFLLELEKTGDTSWKMPVVSQKAFHRNIPLLAVGTASDGSRISSPVFSLR